MRRTARVSATAAATALLVCCGAAGPALAADGHGKVHGQSKVDGQSKVAKVAKVKDPLAAARKRALADLTVYAKRLAAVDAIAVASPLLTSDEAGAFGEVVQLSARPSADDLMAARGNAKSDLALIDHDLADAAGDIAAAESAYALLGSGAPVDPGATP